MAPIPTDFTPGFSVIPAISLPYQIEIPHSSYYETDRYIDIRFPKRLVLKGLKISTEKDRNLKAFTVQYNKIESAPDDMVDIVWRQVTPVEPMV